MQTEGYSLLVDNDAHKAGGCRRRTERCASTQSELASLATAFPLRSFVLLLRDLHHVECDAATERVVPASPSKRSGPESESVRACRSAPRRPRTSSALRAASTSVPAQQLQYETSTARALRERAEQKIALRATLILNTNLRLFELLIQLGLAQRLAGPTGSTPFGVAHVHWYRQADATKRLADAAERN